jgi:hypothetical protein
MAQTDRIFYRVSGTHSSVSSSEETTVQLPTPSGNAGIWLLKSFHYVHSAGTVTYTPRLGQTAAWTNDDVDERMTYSSTTAGDNISDVFAADIPCKSDSNGRLYFRPGFASGSNNSGAFEFFFEYVRGA